MGGPHITGLRQVSRTVADVDRSVEFYAEVLGLEVLGRFGPLAFLDLGGVRLLLEAGDAPTEAGSILYLAVDDLDVAYEDLRERGVEFVDEPHLIHRDDDGTFGPAGEEEWMVFLRDPDDQLVALSSRRSPHAG